MTIPKDSSPYFLVNCNHLVNSAVSPVINQASEAFSNKKWTFYFYTWAHRGAQRKESCQDHIVEALVSLQQDLGVRGQGAS